MHHVDMQKLSLPKQSPRAINDVTQEARSASTPLPQTDEQFRTLAELKVKAAATVQPDALPLKAPFSCSQARHLDSLGTMLLILSAIAGLFLMTASGFTTYVNRLGQHVQEWSLFLVLSGGFPYALIIIGGGGILNLLLSSFAIVVEASHRKINPED